MSFVSLRQLLAYAADNLGHQIFETDRYREMVRRALSASQRWHQRECALKAPLVVTFVLAMMLYRSTSLANLLKKVLGSYRTEFPSLSLKAITPEAICHARARLGVDPVRLVFEMLGSDVKPAPSFRGLRVWAMDGSAFNTPDTSANKKRFGRPKASRGTTAFPQLRIVPLVDVTTRQIRSVVVQKCNGSERDAAGTLLKNLNRGDLVLWDRGFSAAWLFAAARKRRVHVLGRIASSWKPAVVKRLGPGDSIVIVQGDVPKKHRTGGARVAVRMRMIEYQIDGGETIRLLTDLMAPTAYPALELAKLYHARWECELAYDEIKNHLATVATGSLDLVFRSKTPDGVLQEVYALLTLYNMIRALMAEAARCHSIDPLDISFVETVQVLRETTPRLHFATQQTWDQILQQLLTDIAECRNTRPRRPRRCPRAKRIKMTKFPLKRKSHHEEYLDAEETLALCG